nr:hypothetical protein [uncultured Roseobacter sp.]
MLCAFRKFKTDEAGAVTVDWVVLTAAVVGLAVALVLELRAGSSGVTAETKSFLGTQVVGQIGTSSP